MNDALYCCYMFMFVCAAAAVVVVSVVIIGETTMPRRTEHCMNRRTFKQMNTCTHTYREMNDGEKIIINRYVTIAAAVMRRPILPNSI